MSRHPFAVLSMLAVGGALAIAIPSLRADAVVLAPVARLAAPVSTRREVAVLAGGCFWGVQGVFSHVRGVVSTTAGYEGGSEADADDEAVSTGRTGHAEAVRIVFDPSQVNYAELLRIYFSVATDPTTLDAQGPDHGRQYRSVLFPQSPAQARVARAYIGQLAAGHVYARPIVTTLERAPGFFPAEAHHQDFMSRNPNHPYILINDRPKVEALKRMFPGRWRA